MRRRLKWFKARLSIHENSMGRDLYLYLCVVSEYSSLTVVLAVGFCRSRTVFQPSDLRVFVLKGALLTLVQLGWTLDISFSRPLKTNGSQTGRHVFT